MDQSSIQQLDDLIGTDRPAPVIPRQARCVPRAAKDLSSRIAEELAALRYGYGLFAPWIDALVGPAIREMCGVTLGDDPEEVRWKVEVQLRDLSARLPDELRTAIVGAFAIHPGTRLLTYSERVRRTSRRLDLDDRVVRRRIAEAIKQLAALAGPVQVVPGNGRRPAVHWTIVVVDVEQFGDRRWTNANQVAIRRGLYRSLHSAIEAAAIPWHCCDKDRDDSVFILAAGDLPKAAFVEALPMALVDALQRHNHTHLETERIRLWMALHAGEISYDDYGVAAVSVNLAFRLLDAPALKTALATSSNWATTRKRALRRTGTAAVPQVREPARPSGHARLPRLHRPPQRTVRRGAGSE